MWAMSPSATASLLPFSTPFEAVVFRPAGVVRPGPSASAKVPITSPLASFGSHLSFCSTLPAMSSASVARYTDDENGSGATARPSSSAITTSST